MKDDDDLTKIERESYVVMTILAVLLIALFSAGVYVVADLL